MELDLIARRIVRRAFLACLLASFLGASAAVAMGAWIIWRLLAV